jgi:predicted alpha/beta-hydrolase family hydrolase
MSEQRPTPVLGAKRDEFGAFTAKLVARMMLSDQIR